MRNFGALVVLVAALTVAGAKYVPSLPRDAGKKAEPAAGEQLVGGKALLAAPDGLRSRIDTAEVPECSCPAPGAGEQDYLVVTLPDPLISSSGYRFDSLVDALQRAVETQHFVLDSYCYPWKSGVKRLERAAPRDQLSIAFLLGTDRWKNDGRLNMTAQPERSSNAFPLYQGRPGILVFRQTDESSRPNTRVIFLVGETATRGIDRGAFRTALKWMKAYNAFSRDKPIRVLGPYFSGSQTSLIDAINEWIKQDIRFQIVSGSATGINGRKFENRFGGCKVTFQTTVHSEVVLNAELMKYLRGEGKKQNGEEEKPKIVVLMESNTEYGNKAPKDNRFIRLPFPLHISDVRSAYGRTQTDSGSTLPQLASFAGKLHIPAIEESNPTDTEPSLTPSVTATIMERVLSQILTTISREQAQYVVILATTLKDTIFLATQIRTYCPDVQLLLSSSDLMFNHPDYRYYFQGALVVSTYPLCSRNQMWSYPFRGNGRRLLLPSEDCQGIYNAAIALLARDNEPNDLKSLLEYGPPFEKDADCCHRPPVWISIIGQSGPHPLHSVVPTNDGCTPEEQKEWEDSESHVYAAEAKALELLPFEPQYTGYWGWSCLGMLFFCVLLGCWTFRSLRKAMDHSGWGEPLFYFLLCWAALAVVIFSTLAIVWIQWRSSQGGIDRYPPDVLLFVERASDIAGGVTPVLPVVFLSMAIFCLAYHQLDRRRLHVKARLEKPFPDLGSEPLKKIKKIDRELDHFLRLPLKEIFRRRWRTTYPALLILFFIFYSVYGSYVPSVEAAFVNHFLWGAFVFFTLLLAYVFQQFRLLWDMLHDLLREIAKLPLGKAFDRLPKAVTDMFGPYLSSPSPGKKSQEELPLQQLRALALQYRVVRQRLQKTFHLSDSDREILGSELNLVILPVQATFTSAAQACVKALNLCWMYLSVREGHNDPATADAAGKSAAETVDPYLTRLCNRAEIRDADSIEALQTWLHLAEDFAAIEITAYLSQFFVQLRKLARSLGWGSLLAILAIVSYPFHPQRLMLTIAGALVLFLVGYVFYILVHIELDEVVSRIRKSTPDRLNFSWDFVHSIALSIVPLLGVLAAASPDLSDVLHALLDPIYQVMK